MGIQRNTTKGFQSRVKGETNDITKDGVAFVIDGYGHKTNGLPLTSGMVKQTPALLLLSFASLGVDNAFSNNTCCFLCPSFSLVCLQLCGSIFKSVICDFWENVVVLKNWHVCTHTPMYSHMYTHCSLVAKLI